MSTMREDSTALTEQQPADMKADLGKVAEVRQALRNRRVAWARRELIRPAASSYAVASVTREDPQGTPAPGHAWSINVEAVNRERLLRGWTQRELARRAGVDQGTLSDLLARRRRPTLGTVQAICAALRLTLAQVITFDDEE